jgi:hypothetical protein
MNQSLPGETTNPLFAAIWAAKIFFATFNIDVFYKLILSASVCEAPFTRHRSKRNKRLEGQHAATVIQYRDTDFQLTLTTALSHARPGSLWGPMDVKQIWQELIPSFFPI